MQYKSQQLDVRAKRMSTSRNTKQTRTKTITILVEKLILNG